MGPGTPGPVRTADTGPPTADPCHPSSTRAKGALRRDTRPGAVETPILSWTTISARGPATLTSPEDSDRSGTAAGGTTATGTSRTGAGKAKEQPPVVSSHAPRVRLSVVRGVGAGQGILLRRVASIIGSSTGVKLLLRHPDVSGLHCAIVNTGGLVYVRDLQGRQGTFLNDLKAEHEVIQDGDVIKIHPWQLRVEILTPKVADTKDVTGLGLEPAPALEPDNLLLRIFAPAQKQLQQHHSSGRSAD